MLWLPVEVLSQILQHALRTTKNPSGVVVARESPLFLAHICSHWRFTAFSVPDIWSFIDVSVTTATTSHIHNRTELFQLHLSLSKGAPLSIALVSDSKDQDSDIIQPFIHTLVPHFPRCRSLYMDLPYSSLIALDRLVTPQSFSSLRDITFHGDTPASQQHSFCAFSEAPALSTATIWGSHYSLGYVPFPSSQLTHLDVSLGVDHVFWLLHEASHVTECRVFCLDTQSLAGEYYRGLVAPLTLPHLHSLHISGSDSGGFLLNLIMTPVLESFSCLLLSIINPLSIIVGTPTTKLTTSPYLLYFIEDLDSKLQNLRELRIEDWSEPIDDVLRGHVLPSLETLTIRLSKEPDL